MPDIWSDEYWAKKGDVSLYVYRKRATAPKQGEKPLPVMATSRPPSARRASAEPMCLTVAPR